MIPFITSVLAVAVGTANPAMPVDADNSLTTCLVSHASAADRSVLIKWVFTVMAASPEVQSLSSVTPAQRNDLSKQAGQLFNRLLTVDCRAEAVSSIKTNGEGTINESFSVLGKTAMEGLMGDPVVAKSMTGILTGIDLREWANLMIDAGLGPDGKRLKR